MMRVVLENVLLFLLPTGQVPLAVATAILLASSSGAADADVDVDIAGAQVRAVRVGK